MHIMVTDFSVDSKSVVERLASPAGAVSVVALAPGEGLEEACARAAGLQEQELLVVTRVPLPEDVRKRRPQLAVLFPGVSNRANIKGHDSGACELLPGVVVGPLVGPPETTHRRLAEVVRNAGVATSCRPEMHNWLRVTSAWLAPLRGAVIAAALQDRNLAATEDLITIATRAARERLRVLKAGELPLELRCRLLLALPEIWAIAAIRRVARALPADGSPSWLPTPAEAVVVSQNLARVAALLHVRTPAADFLDQFSFEAEARARGGGEESAATRASEGTSANGQDVPHQPLAVHQKP